MHIAPQFTWNDLDSIAACCRAHPFATVITSSADGHEAQHLPLLCERVGEQLVLHGHAALASPVWRAAQALAVFHGPHAYISAAWYDAPDTVPTWNYLAVHCRGALTALDDAAAPALFDRLADTLGDAGRARWQAALTATTAQRLTRMIRWFRIDVTMVQAQAKLSQHHPLERRQRVIAALEQTGDDGRAVAAAMQRTLAGAAPWPAP